MEYLIGNTPLVFVEEYKGTKIYAKLEYYNPTGSIKDRVAYNMIISAINDNKLSKSKGKIVEATSGNTGIGLAYVSSKLGIECVITMPENMSQERITLMKAMGAKIILTKKELGMKGAKEEAEKLEKEGYFLINQFENENNTETHIKYTAPEIFNQLPNVDTIISPFGTGGTAMGIAKYIKLNKKNAKVIGIEPFESPLITQNISGPHEIAGIGANFIPKIFDKEFIDKIITVKSNEAKLGARQLLKNFGIISGVSGGCAYIGAKQLIDSNYISNNMLIIIPDTGFRYMSAGLYE